MNLRVKRLDDTAILPRRASGGAVGYDLYCHEDVSIPQGHRHLVGTGVAILPWFFYRDHGKIVSFID